MKMLRSVVEGTVYIDTELMSYRRPDRHMALHIYPVEDGAILYFTDTTEEKLMQMRAARTQKLLQASLDALLAQVVVLDCTGTVIASNQAWRRFAVGHGFLAPTTRRRSTTFGSTRRRSYAAPRPSGSATRSRHFWRGGGAACVSSMPCTRPARCVGST